MRILKIIAVLCVLLILVLLGGFIYVKTALPNVGDAPDLVIESTPERLEHGKYLANSVMGCMDCHAQRDFSLFAGPVVEGTRGAGGEHWGHHNGFDGELVAPNITPYALKDWTDGEIYRAITMGVDKDGNALFPIMPYLRFGQLADEDIYSVIAYLRSIPPIVSATQERELDFPLNLIVNTIPMKQEQKMEKTTVANRIAHGKYMLTAAACAECHTPQEKGKFITELELAGGFEFVMPNDVVCRSANITPCKETGIGQWSSQEFVDRFNAYGEDFVPHIVGKGEYNTIMPWGYYSNMKGDDLEAIYAYLQSLEPNRHSVEKYSVVSHNE